MMPSRKRSNRMISCLLHSTLFASGLCITLCDARAPPRQGVQAPAPPTTARRGHIPKLSRCGCEDTLNEEQLKILHWGACATEEKLLLECGKRRQEALDLGTMPKCTGGTNKINGLHLRGGFVDGSIPRRLTKTSEPSLLRLPAQPSFGMLSGCYSR